MTIKGSTPARRGGVCGWFGEFQAMEAPEGTLGAMARSLGGEGAGTPAQRSAAIHAAGPSAVRRLFHDDRVMAAIDGAPYWSHPDLAERAARDGDGAALAEAYRRFGQDCLSHVHGPFTLAVIDRHEQRGVVAIDRLGTMGMCFARPHGGGLVFGSTTAPVIAHTAVSSRLSHQAIYDYLLLYRIPAPITIFADVEKLLPAQYVAFDRGSVRTGFYWQVPYGQGAEADEATLRQALFDNLRGAIGRATEGEDPARIGAFLSGGLDSSTVSGLFREVNGAASKAFTVGFDVDGYDETEYAEAAARHFGIEHHVYRMTPDDVCELIPRMNEALDEPNGNSSCAPTYYCAKLAREHDVDVMLAGDGGDELFAGNPWYAQMKLFDLYGAVPAVLRRMVIEPLAFGLPGGESFFLTRKARRYITRARIPMPDRMFTPEAGSIVDTDDILIPELLSDIDREHPLKIMRDVYQRTASPHLVHRMLHQDLTVILADSDLRKVNSMCALAGVRVRYPMLDERVVELAAGLSPKYLINGFEPRYFFRRAVEDYLPEKIINKSKHGFGLPFAHWLKASARLQDLAYASLDRFKDRGVVRTDYIETLIDRQRHSTHPGHSGPVWDLMLLDYWLDTHVDAAASNKEMEPA